MAVTRCDSSMAHRRSGRMERLVQDPFQRPSRARAHIHTAMATRQITSWWDGCAIALYDGQVKPN